MRYLLFIVAITATMFCNGQQITSGEYFIDIDPGYGNGTAFSFETGSSIDISQTINVAGLTSGFHYLYFRLQDNEGKWGQTSSKAFFKSFKFEEAEDLTIGEYFIDMDPGFGNGTTFSLQEGSEIEFSQNIQVEKLAFGYHTFYYRIKDKNGQWSQTSNKSFFKSVSLKGAESLTEGEYFIDEDPGFGNGIAFTVDSNTEIDTYFNIAIEQYSDGYHTIYYRLKDNEGKWGQTSNKSIYKVVTPKLSRLYYQIDNVDVRTVNIHPPSDNFEHSINEDISSLDAGDHQIKFWVVNDLEIQSEVWAEKFTISTSTGTAGLFDEALSVYPNPVVDKVTVKTGSEVLSISVYSLSGQLVLQSNTEQKTVDLQNLSSGTYLMSIKTDRGIIIKQIIKK